MTAVPAGTVLWVASEDAKSQPVTETFRSIMLAVKVLIILSTKMNIHTGYIKPIKGAIELYIYLIRSPRNDI